MATRNDYSITIGDIGVNGTTTANYIGGTSWGDPRFDGLVDDFQMFGYELSADQVLEVFEGGANDAPVAVDDAYSTDEGAALEVDAPGVLTNDTDTEGATLTAAIGTQPTHGDVTLDNVLITPAGPFALYDFDLAAPGPTAADLVALARAVRDGVVAAFGVRLEPEPVLVGLTL